MYSAQEVRCSRLSVRPGTTTWRTHMGTFAFRHRLHKGRGGVHLPAGDLPVTLLLMVLYVVEHQVGVGQNVLIVPSGLPEVSMQVWTPLP